MKYELNSESRMARRYYTPIRSRAMLNQQYQEGVSKEERRLLFEKRAEIECSYCPDPPEFNTY